ncbi:MAG: glycosyltransferase family 2 protein [Chloroflexi bacterium]|nr:glycosyltransferase family 2 protein [Chloroflexota bacterium]
MIAVIFWACVFFVLYTYILYPLLLGILASLVPAKKPYDRYEPDVTLLIAAYNEKNAIAAKLENCLALDYPHDHLQILIAADGSDDGTDDIVRGFGERGVELSFDPQRNGKMAAIDRAMKVARGEIIVMSDANNLYNPMAVRALVAPFQDNTVGASGGAKKILEGDGVLGSSEGLYWKYESWIKKQETRLGCTTGAAGEAFAIRRSLFTSPPRGIINDDFYLMMTVIKRGYRVIYVPQAESYERVSLTPADEVERRTRIIAGRYQALTLLGGLLPFNKPLIVWQVLSHKFLRPLVAFFMIGAFLSSLASIIWTYPTSTTMPFWRLAAPFNWIFFSAQLFFYILAWLGRYFENSGGLGKLLYLPMFLVNSNFAAVQGLIRFLARRQSTQWQRVNRRDGG